MTFIKKLINRCCVNSFRKHSVSKVFTFALPVSPLFLFILYGCQTPSKLTANDRKQDIEYLANWAHDYSPFVNLNEKQKGIPSYEECLFAFH